MRQVITIQIPRPDIEDLTKERRKELIAQMSKFIAEQIMFQEEMRKQNEELQYWQNKMVEWEIEDAINEIKHGKSI